VTDIKVLMVDVDGVIVGHPERRWHHHMKRDLGLDPRLLFEEFFPFHWADVVEGRATLPDRLAAWLPGVAPHVSSDEFIAFWLARDSELIPGVLADLAHLRAAGVQLHLATNQEHLRAAHLWNEVALSAHFDAIHYAAALGTSKPAAAFFHAATVRSGFRPDQIGFIDDREDNVTAARAFGWRAAVWTHESRLAEVLAAWSPATWGDERLAY
jgi:putative hydrolase of the HAD superfamily